MLVIKKWRDSTILNMIENPIYKGDFIHGKRTNHPTYYENVVEPLVSKAMWEKLSSSKEKELKKLYEKLNLYLFTKTKMSKMWKNFRRQSLIQKES